MARKKDDVPGDAEHVETTTPAAGEDTFFDDEKDGAPSGAPPANAPGTEALSTQDLLRLLLKQGETNETIAAAIAKIAEASENGPIRQIPASKALFKTPWNPTGKKRGKRIRLSRATYLNGHRLREMMMSEDEINLCNSVKAGLYNGRRWTVQVKEAAGQSEGREVLIWIPNKSTADRLQLAKDSVHPSDPSKNGLVAILERIVDEQSRVVLA